MVLDTSILSGGNKICEVHAPNIFFDKKEVDICCPHLNLGAVCPVLAGVLRPLVVPDLHQPRVELGAADPALLPRPRDLGNVGLGQVFLGNGSLPQPPREIIR